MKALLKSLKLARKQLVSIAKAMPNEDAYSSPYSIASSLVDAIDDGIKELGPAIKEAEAISKKDKNKSKLPNRAKEWCKID